MIISKTQSYVENTKYHCVIVLFECDHCKNNFTLNGEAASEKYRNKFHYCSKKCVYDHRRGKKRPEIWKQKRIIICGTCEKEKLVFKSTIKNTIGKYNFCSRKCYVKAIENKLIIRIIPDEEKEKLKIRSSIVNKGNKHRVGKIQTKETKTLISNKAKIRLSNPENNGMFGKFHSEKTKQKMSKIVSFEIISGKRKSYGKNNHKTGKYISSKTNIEMYYRSFWELECMKWLDENNNVLFYHYESFRILYSYNVDGKQQTRNYIPDFLIEFKDKTKEIWELKPKEFKDTIKNKAKKSFAIEYCLRNNINQYKILTKEDLIFSNILKK